MNKFWGKSYYYKGKIIGVVKGLGEGQYITAYYGENGGRHRVRNYKELPVCKTPEEAQIYLDKFAVSHNLSANAL